MNRPLSRVPVWGWLLLAVALTALAVWVFLNRDWWPRGEALHVALSPLIAQTGTDQALVAQAVWDNYLEARTNASIWSGVYFGFTFVAAALSALAGLILKFEYIVKTDALKKDLAAVMSVGAALLITVSTSGDFQRKWQANRIAAAELERVGYELLASGATDPRHHLTTVGKILLDRHTSIVGAGTQVVAPTVLGNPKAAPAAASLATSSAKP